MKANDMAIVLLVNIIFYVEWIVYVYLWGIAPRGTKRHSGPHLQFDVRCKTIERKLGQSRAKSAKTATLEIPKPPYIDVYGGGARCAPCSLEKLPDDGASFFAEYFLFFIFANVYKHRKYEFYLVYKWIRKKHRILYNTFCISPKKRENFLLCFQSLPFYPFTLYVQHCRFTSGYWI